MGQHRCASSAGRSLTDAAFPMAKFKVGDKVRFVRIAGPDGDCLLGKEGVIAPFDHPREWEVSVHFPHIAHRFKTLGCFESELEPLVPPDTWAADKVRELVKPKPMDAEREHQTVLMEGGSGG